MPKLPGISHAAAVRVFTRLGFRIAREGKHTVMSNGRVRLTILATIPSTPSQWLPSLEMPV